MTMQTPPSIHPRSMARLAGVGALLTGALALAFVPACTQEEESPPASQAANMKTVVIPVEGMSCVACVARVKKTLTSIAGVGDVQVSLAERNARVRFDPSRLAPDRLVAAINGLGYKAGTPTEAR